MVLKVLPIYPGAIQRDSHVNHTRLRSVVSGFGIKGLMERL